MTVRWSGSCDEWMYVEYEKCNAKNGGSGIFFFIT